MAKRWKLKYAPGVTRAGTAVVKIVHAEGAPHCPECDAGWPTWDPDWGPECRACGYFDVEADRRQREIDLVE